jgi:dipeptidase E
MKKLLLASNGSFLISQGYQLLGIPKDLLHIAYITTASKGVANKDYLERHKKAMKRHGYAFEEIDIEGKSVRELRKIFKEKNVIHVEGGNTFYLLKAMKEHGAGALIAKLVNDGMTYVGTSAGAYIACPTIEMSTWGPKHSESYGLKDLAALNLVPFLLKVHYTDDMKELVKKMIAACAYPVHILRDGQGILADGTRYKFIGKDKEVKL